MKRKRVKTSRKKATQRSKRNGKAKRVRRIRIPRRVNQFQSPEHLKALAALARMRREKLSLSKASRLEHIKPNTFLRHVGSAVYRSGPGKPWKARKLDTLRATMRIQTPKGPVYEVVRSSRERTRLALHDNALRRVRAAEDGAVEALQEFKDLTVAGHVLLTDLDQLIQQEAAGELDFDNLYYSVGGAS